LFSSYSAGTWTFAPNPGAALTITATNNAVNGAFKNEVLYTASLGSVQVISEGGTIRLLGGTVQGISINPLLTTALLGYVAPVDTTSLGDVSQSFKGSLGAQDAIIFCVKSISTGGVEAPTVPVPPALMLFAPGLLGLFGIRKRLKG
jgi:hypothetical protein